MVVAGNGLYKYYKIKELSEFTPDHTQVNNKPPTVSSAYSCFCWLEDSTLIVGTEVGELLALTSDGEFRHLIDSSPLDNFKVETLVSYSRGFIAGGD